LFPRKIELFPGSLYYSSGTEDSIHGRPPAWNWLDLVAALDAKIH